LALASKNLGLGLSSKTTRPAFALASKTVGLGLRL